MVSSSVATEREEFRAKDTHDASQYLIRHDLKTPPFDFIQIGQCSSIVVRSAEVYLAQKRRNRNGYWF